jgi:hypothetical protein
MVDQYLHTDAIDHKEALECGGDYCGDSLAVKCPRPLTLSLRNPYWEVMSLKTSMADMYVKVLLYAACLLFLAFPVSAAASYKVVFKDGQTVEAEAYTLKGGTITLKYKTGKASFPRGVVKSITNKSGKVLLLSKPGKKLPKRRNAATTRPIPSGAGFKSKTGINRPSNAGQPETRKNITPATGNPDFYKGMWPEEKDFMKGKKHPFK